MDPKDHKQRVLERMQKDVGLVNMVKGIKIKYLGHVLCGERYRLLQAVLEGRIAGVRPMGGQQNF